MSEKRFKLSSETVLQYQIMDNDTDLNENEVVDLLNEQQSEINSLKLELELGAGAKLFSRRVLERRVKEQQVTIDELEKNFDDLVKWASEIAKRNVILDERIGKIQQAIKRAYEEKPYPTIEDIQKEINNE